VHLCVCTGKMMGEGVAKTRGTAGKKSSDQYTDKVGTVRTLTFTGTRRIVEWSQVRVRLGEHTEKRASHQ
jgi:hypothetical protein